MMILDTVMGIPCYASGWRNMGMVHYGNAPANIDDDGSGDPHNDPDFQARTSYRNPDPITGIPRWLNADLVPYIVVPPQLIRAVPGIVLGCWAEVFNPFTGKGCLAVVGDVGPRLKIGELSIAAAIMLGIPPSPTSGGEQRRGIKYTFFPGEPAVIPCFKEAGKLDLIDPIAFALQVWEGP